MRPQDIEILKELGFHIKTIKYKYPEDLLEQFGIHNYHSPVDVQIVASFTSPESIAKLQENLLLLDAITKSQNPAVMKLLEDLRVLTGLTRDD